MKTGPRKKSLKLGKVIASVYDVYFPSEHGHFGTDADHVPVFPSNDFTPEVGSMDSSRPQDPASDNTTSGPSPVAE